MGAAGATAGCSGRAERRHKEQRARPPVGNISLGYWPGRSLASSANTDCNQMLPGMRSLPQTARPAGKPTLAPWMRCHGDAASPRGVGVSSAPALARPPSPVFYCSRLCSWRPAGQFGEPGPALAWMGTMRSARSEVPAASCLLTQSLATRAGDPSRSRHPVGLPVGSQCPLEGALCQALPLCSCSLALIGRAVPPNTSSTTT